MVPLSPNGRALSAPTRAFTLIELAAVVVCIGLLAALLQPSVRDALGTSQRLTCLERLHNIGQASLLYSADDPHYAAIPVHRLQTQQDPENPTFIGAYEWGGKSGIGRDDFVSRYAGSILGSKYGTAAGFGPATRPLNTYLYPSGFAATDLPFNRRNAAFDTQLELDAFRCPSDDRPPPAAHCPDWTSLPRRSSYDHFGTSYAANLFMISGGGEMRSNSPYLRPVTRVVNPARTIAYEENIGRWAWAARREISGCAEVVGGPGIDPGPTQAIPGWHGKDWIYNRSFIDSHAETQAVYIEGTEDREGYANHYRNELLSEYPPAECDGSPNSGSFEYYQCVIVRGDGWQKDTLPDPPTCTGLVYPCSGRASYECCVSPE